MYGGGLLMSLHRQEVYHTKEKIRKGLHGCLVGYGGGEGIETWWRGLNGGDGVMGGERQTRGEHCLAYFAAYLNTHVAYTTAYCNTAEYGWYSGVIQLNTSGIVVLYSWILVVERCHTAEY